MKILQISNKSPWPPAEGGPIAMNALTVGLQEAGHEVHVLTMSTPKFPVDEHSIPDEYKTRTNYRAVSVDNRLRAMDALKCLLRSQSYNIHRFISKDFEEALETRLGETRYDVILLESLYVTPYLELIRRCSDAKVVMRAHNIEHRIWERLARACRNPLTRIYLKILGKQLLRYEEAVLPKLDGIAAITDKDADFFRPLLNRTKLEVVPFGILPSAYIFTPQEGRHISLCHIGSMDWMPNTEGIRWFLEKCWPGLHSVFPDLKFYLAGRNMPAWLKARRFPNVEVVGEVEDAHAFMTNHPVMVVPLLSGSGVRVKIIEAMALGRTVITTSMGAEGIRFTKDENLLIADSPVAFFEKIKSVIRDPEHCACIGASARQMIETRHNSGIATEAMLKLIGSI